MPRPEITPIIPPTANIVDYSLLGQTATKISVKLINYQLFQPVTVETTFHTASGTKVASDRKTLITEEVATWGTDDNTLIDIIVSIYGLTKI